MNFPMHGVLTFKTQFFMHVLVFKTWMHYIGKKNDFSCLGLIVRSSCAY